MFESIILIGPGTDLFPLINSHLEITNLPILNKPLLEYNIEFLLPISKTLYIVILEEKKEAVEKIVVKYNANIRVIGIPYYDGTVSSILRTKCMITSDNIIVTKGDLITNINIKDVAERFIKSQAYFLTILADAKCENVTLGIQENNLVFYSSESVQEFPENFFTKGKVTLSRELDTVQFYMFKKEILRMFNEETFEFKNNLLPKIVEQFRVIKPVHLYFDENSLICQIKNKEDYLSINRILKLRLQSENNAIFDKSKQKEVKQYIKKNGLKDFSNYLGITEIEEDTIVINSIIGDNTRIGLHSKVFSSIIMDSVQIGSGCVIDRCIIGSNVIIQPGSTLIDCIISPGYLFTAEIKGDNDVFSTNTN